MKATYDTHADGFIEDNESESESKESGTNAAACLSISGDLLIDPWEPETSNRIVPYPCFPIPMLSEPIGMNQCRLPLIGNVVYRPHCCE
jgi:hypothetical protein